MCLWKPVFTSCVEYVVEFIDAKVVEMTILLVSRTYHALQARMTLGVQHQLLVHWEREACLHYLNMRILHKLQFKNMKKTNYNMLCYIIRTFHV